MRRILLSVFLLVAAAVLLFAWNWIRAGIDVTADEANRSLHQGFAVPDSATRIRFYSTPRYTRLTFRVSQKSFYAWCARMQFRKHPITRESPAGAFDIVGREAVRWLMLEEGVSFSSFTDEQACGISGSYNPADGTCCAEFFCR